MTAKRLKGAAGLDQHELPALRTPQDAETWLEVVGRAVAEGKLSHNQGRTVATTVREWLKAHEAGKVAERVEELREQVAALRERHRLKALK